MMKNFVESMAAVLLAMACVTGSAKAQTAPALPPAAMAYSPGVAEDKISWQLFVEVVSPAPAPNPMQALTFETWATDAETFTSGTTPPVWPTGPTAERNKKRFQASNLGLHRPARLKVAVDSSGVPTKCDPPQDPAAGNFPTTASPKPATDCLAEEVRRNKPSFDYIVQNNLYSVAGLATNFPLAAPIELPQSSDLKKAGIEVKVDWVPLNTVVTWLNANLAKPIDAAFVRKNYFITSQSDGTDYALVSMHISLKDRPNWLWATFEHQMNPGRCDTMGCYDKFGLPPAQASIPPAAKGNTQYAACSKKSAALAKMFRGLPAVWNNYCLKDTQIDFVSVQSATKGQPLLNGDSVVERILAGVPIAQSSCISCHAYATFGSKGCVAQTNPGISSPAPIGAVTQQAGQKRYDFVWGVISIPNVVCP